MGAVLGTQAGRGLRIASRTNGANLDFPFVKNALLFVVPNIGKGLGKILSVAIPSCSVLVL